MSQDTKQQAALDPQRGLAQQLGKTFFVTVGISAAFCLAGVLFKQPFGDALTTMVEAIIDGLGWFYLLCTAFFLVFVAYLGFGKFGKVKLTWGVIMALLAAVLLVAGGLDALQNGAILAATPFAVIMLFMAWSLHRAMSDDYAKPSRTP